MRAVCLVLVLPLVASIWYAPARAMDADFFEKKIRPVLVERCYQCHSAGAKGPKGGLLLDSAGGIREGGDSGEVVVPGDVAESLLIDAIASTGEASDMPPDGKLPDRVVADFRRWVEAGAPLPEHGTSVGGATRGAIDPAIGRDFWSFRPAEVQRLPDVSEPGWPRNRIDAFILRGLDERAMHPSPEAGRRTLLRRLTFDLTGLPPTAGEVESFLADRGPDAYERVVERLLGSAHHGERWGRLWLDVARYAEDNPTSESTNKPPRNPHAYRDWVIRALNEDLPYDEFVRRQLAADLMPALPPGERAALGFLGLAPVYHKEPKLSAEVIATIVADEWDERIDTLTRGLLGLTVACARCHDHKFDPIATEDYYALAGVMASTQIVERPLVEADRTTEEALAEVNRQLVDLNLKLNYAKQMKKTEGAGDDEGGDPSRHDPAIADLEARIKALKETRRFEGPTATAVRDAGLWVDGDDPAWTTLDYRPGVPRNLPVFIRGNAANPGKVVPRRFLPVLARGEPMPFRRGSGRLELANCIVGDAASLAGRVIVNRVWGWHFGRPLVTTPSNYGRLGDPPSHPELLDDLAARFIAGGWSLKALHREIVLSATYRQSSRHDDAYQAADPENRWLWRAHRRRLDVEAWRDAILEFADARDPALGGPSFDLDDADAGRRTVYGTVSRRKPASVLRLFDFPDANRHSEIRDLTTTPLQQLYFFNSPFLLKHAGALADEAISGPGTPDDRARALYRKLLGRDPTDDELRRAVRLTDDDDGDGDGEDDGEGPGGIDRSRMRDAWTLLSQALLISNEFLFLD